MDGMLKLSEYEGKMLSPEEIALVTFYKERKDAKSKQSVESEKAMLKRALQTKSMHMMVNTEPSSSISGSSPRADRPPSSVVPGGPTKEQMAKSAAADKTAKAKAKAAAAAAAAAAVVPGKKTRRRMDISSSSDSDSSEDEAEVRRKKRIRREQDQTSLDSATYAADGLLQTSMLDLTTATATSGKSGVLEWALPGFNFDRNQTVALKLTIPRAGRQNYAVNIAPEEGDEDLERKIQGYEGGERDQSTAEYGWKTPCTTHPHHNPSLTSARLQPCGHSTYVCQPRDHQMVIQ